MRAAKQMEKATDHLASRLTCLICRELYKKLKYLPCYHSYCEECLVKLIQSKLESTITCPECKITSSIPNGEVQRLPNNYFMNRLLAEAALNRKLERIEEEKCGLCVREDSKVEVLCQNCGTFLCSCCYDDHKYSRKKYKDHVVLLLNELRSKGKNLTIKPKVVLCQEHELELQFYCETCDQLVCQYCIMKDHLNNHNHNTVKEVATKYKKKLDEIMEPVGKMIERLSTTYENIINWRNKIGTQADDISKEIDRYYEGLYQKLQQQRDELQKELREAFAQKTNKVTLQLGQVKHIQTQLEQIKELNTAIIKNGSDQETLLMKRQVADDVRKLSDSYSKLDTQPVQLSIMEFIPIEEYKTSMPQFGHLFDGAYSCTSETSVIPEWVFEGENVEFNVITKDKNNQLCHKGGSKIVIHAQLSTGNTIPVMIKDNEDGSYSASFLANQVGEIKLSVTIKEQNIKGSPFGIWVRRKYTTIDTPNKVIAKVGRMGAPWGIAFSRNGMWAVTDRSNHSVRIFDSQSHKMIQSFGSSGNDKGKFNCPSGITFDHNNDLYVTDSWNNRVQKFNASGRYLLHFGSRGSGSGQLNNPLGILAHNNQVYVVENSGNRISVFQLDGRFSRIIGSGHLKSPHYIAVNDDQLLVADCGHHCISIFTMDGNYVGKFGTQGSSSGRLKNPTGIVINIYGFILVTDEHNNRVSIFDKHGEFLHSFGSKGSGHGQFSLPHGIAISPIGDIYVCDSNNERIQIF